MHRETTRLLDSSDIILEIANGRILRDIYVFAFRLFSHVIENRLS